MEWTMTNSIKTLVTSVIALVMFTVATGIVYPALIWGIAIVGGWDTPPKDLLAPKYTDSTLFTARPSACDYATVPSGASNLGPTSAQLQTLINTRDSAMRASNGIPANVPMATDMLYASGSGLDPHISVYAAQLQRNRIARERHLSLAVVDSLIAAHTVQPQFNVLGTALVNVVSLNDALTQR